MLLQVCSSLIALRMPVEAPAACRREIICCGIFGSGSLRPVCFSFASFFLLDFFFASFFLLESSPLVLSRSYQFRTCNAYFIVAVVDKNIFQFGQDILRPSEEVQQT